jgi:hypothetical protein
MSKYDTPEPHINTSLLHIGHVDVAIDVSNPYGIHDYKIWNN